MQLTGNLVKNDGVVAIYSSGKHDMTVQDPTGLRAPRTQAVARFVSGFGADALPPEVVDYARRIVFDGIGALVAATHPSVTAAAGVAKFADRFAGSGPATLIGRGRKVDAVSAVLANGTLGYAADFEPHHPEAILHPVSILGPVAFALSEAEGRSGRDAVAAIVLGCEIVYRVSMALDPRGLYALGFHPSAIAGTFGAAAAAAWLMRLDEGETARALGLAALQTSGLLAWQDDPREDARPFQMGMAARNGVTAAALAAEGFGAPDRIFDGGHTLFGAYSRAPAPDWLTRDLGAKWDGLMELAVKPYPCVSFLHPALDALEALLTREDVAPEEIAAIDLRFSEAGAHCVDDNPLKGHSAQYILPVRAAMGRLSYLDLFTDRRLENREVARLAAVTTVTRDTGEFDAKFPDFYIGEVTLTLKTGNVLKERRDVARGYPEAPLSDEELKRKFHTVVGEVADDARREALAAAAWSLTEAADLTALMASSAKCPIRHRKNDHKLTYRQRRKT